MYETFLENYCKKHEITEEEARTHAIVKEFLNEKDKIDKQEEQIQRSQTGVQRDNV